MAVPRNGGLLREGTRSQDVSSSEKACKRLRVEKEEGVKDGKAGEKRNSGAVLHGFFSHLSSLPLGLSLFLGHFAGNFVSSALSAGYHETSLSARNGTRCTDLTF